MTHKIVIFEYLMVSDELFLFDGIQIIWMYLMGVFGVFNGTQTMDMAEIILF